MQKSAAGLLPYVLTLFAGTMAWGQSNAGHVNYLEYAQSAFDAYDSAPSPAGIQWMQKEFASMVVFSPFFDSRTSWFPNAYVYQSFYGIAPGSWVQYNHPEWILHDSGGNWLYIPFNC